MLRQALTNQDLALADLQGIASISLKADEPGLHQLAERLGLPLVLYDTAQLQAYEPQLSHRSTAAHAHCGCWGVAESAALALASQRVGTARLLLKRQVLGPATLALAC